MNPGPGILYYQISSDSRDVSVVDGIDSGPVKDIHAEEAVYVRLSVCTPVMQPPRSQ